MAEKYTQWADKSCGVNPFVPGEIKLPNKQMIFRLGRYVLASVVALPRIAVASGLVILHFMIQIIMNEFLLLLVSLGLSWQYNTGQLLDAKYFMPLAVLTFVNVLWVSIS
jgi:hypothetical protein